MFITDVVEGRIYAESLIDLVTAAGITIVYTILYPGDTGLGKAGTSDSEIVWVYGPNAQNENYPINDLTGAVD